MNLLAKIREIFDANRISDRLLATYKSRIVDKVCARYRRNQLKRKDFSIICNNCLAWGIYHKLGLQFTTPTVGLFFFDADYVKFLDNFDFLIRQPLKFKNISKYSKANELLKEKKYPIGVLGDDIEIHFLHYRDEQDAAEKWLKRTARINFDNLFFVFSDQDGFNEELLTLYENLPFENKIFFSSKPAENHPCLIYLDSSNSQYITRNRKYEKQIDIIKWLNGEKNFRK